MSSQFLLLARPWHFQMNVVQEGADLLARHGDLQFIAWADDQAEELVARVEEMLPGLDAIVYGPWNQALPLSKERLEKAEKLKVVGGTFDNRFGWVDFERAMERGISIIDTSRSMTPTVAEFALAMMLNLLRDIPAAIDLVRSGGWKKGTWEKGGWDRPGFVFGDLTGRRVGLAGFGTIHRRLAELLQPFRCEVCVYDPYVDDEVLRIFSVKRCENLRAMAAQSEVFCVGIPPTPATEGLISAEVIDALPRGAVFVLVTRMAVVEQEALWRRVRDGELRVATDVFAPEPPNADAFFRTHRDVLPTPHIAGDSVYCHRRCFTEACRDVVATLRGETARFQVKYSDYELYRGQQPSLPDEG